MAGTVSRQSFTEAPLVQRTTDMRISKAFTSKFLRAADIDDIKDEGTDTAVVTIDRIDMQEVGTDQQEKPVLYFKGIDPGLVLNKTNSTTLGKLLGDETDDWTGKRIGLFTTEVDFSGQMVLAIRVRLKLPKAATTAPKAAELFEEDSIPF